MIASRRIVPADDAQDTVSLSYEHRFLRRRVLRSDGGEEFLVDLERAASLNEGDAFQLEDGRAFAVHAAPEPLFEVTGGDLARFAWHIGNRHTPCQVARDRLFIQRDHVIRGMLEGLGAVLRAVERPFLPEGGAYGHGRTHGHGH